MSPSISDTLRLALLAVFAVTAALLALVILDRPERARAQQALLAGTPPGGRDVAVLAAERGPAPAVVAPVRQAPAAADDRGAGREPTAPGEPEAPQEPVVEHVPAQPSCAEAKLLVDVPRDLPVYERAGGAGRRIGTVPARSAHLDSPMRAWVEGVEPSGAWGRVRVPWVWPQRSGWIRIAGLRQHRTAISVRASLTQRTLRVYRGCRVILEVPSAVGASSSPSPRGRFFVTDLVRVPSDQPQFGSYAFGMSTIQPNTPPGWTGGNQMAIHGTNAPSTIGSAASAGCLRVSEDALRRLRKLVRPGTPVVIEA